LKGLVLKKGDNKMKMKLLLLVSTLTIATAALAAPRFFPVSGAGVGIDSDQSAADETADQQAQSNLQTACSAGTLTSRNKIFDQCSSGPGGQYVCNVNYSGICQIGQ
jgi:hypothetical protein